MNRRSAPSSRGLSTTAALTVADRASGPSRRTPCGAIARVSIVTRRERAADPDARPIPMRPPVRRPRAWPAPRAGVARLAAAGSGMNAATRGRDRTTGGGRRRPVDARSDGDDRPGDHRADNVVGVNGPDAYEIERTPLHPLVESLFARDPGGRSWLPGLLDACEGARAHLGDFVDNPGYLEVPLAVRAQTGMLACFSYPAAPTRQMLGWYIDHPEALTRSTEAQSLPPASAESKLLPPGAAGRRSARRSGARPEPCSRPAAREHAPVADVVAIRGARPVGLRAGDRPAVRVDHRAV